MTASTISGKCLCGQISVSVPQAAFHKTENIGLCYCKNCRQSGGCLASYNLYLTERDVKVQGQPKIYHDNNTDSGATLERAFCKDCGSSIYGKNPKFIGLIAVRLGIFDQLPKPGMALYCKDRSHWNKAIDGVEEHEDMPKLTEHFKMWLQKLCDGSI
ncbi:unnamed protein product [Didymodactylos carnosus]|uniref:CENP-V/GFA domain-containing protein n=2 Tax=Didymodactylos carnosus TaxID=1234261 RepID=A0A8S2E202_9BILA|nr:unnamed protein product [Didymodactylos carnosus]CAF3816224.1 unnamed protein product [Didymodactylos carnosus]